MSKISIWHDVRYQKLWNLKAWQVPRIVEERPIFGGGQATREARSQQERAK